MFRYLLLCLIITLLGLALIYSVTAQAAKDGCADYGWPDARVSLNEGAMCVAGANEIPLPWLRAGLSPAAYQVEP